MAREDAELQDRLLKESQDIIKEFEKGIAYSRMHTRDFQDPDEVIKVSTKLWLSARWGQGVPSRWLLHGFCPPVEGFCFL